MFEHPINYIGDLIFKIGVFVVDGRHPLRIGIIFLLGRMKTVFFLQSPANRLAASSDFVIVDFRSLIGNTGRNDMQMGASDI